MSGWEFRLIVNGRCEAEGSGPDRDSMLREAGHYAMMYGQDGGDVKAYVYPEDDPPPQIKRLLACG